MRPLELKGFLPLPPYAAEISWEPYSGSLSPGLSCPNWTSDAVGPRKGWGCVTVSLTFSSLTNNGGAESQLTVEWSFWFCGSRGGVWENPSTRPHPESVDKLRKVCYWGVQLCYSCLLGREFLLRPPSHCSLISALCCCFLIVFRPVPVSDNCIFSVKLFAQNKKETDFCFILPGPLWKGGGVDCKELFAWCVTWRWEIFSSQDSFILQWRFCLETFYESKDSWTFGHFFWSEIVAFD